MVKPKTLDLNDAPHQTLARALQILEAFSAERPEWGVRELGRELGINPATVLRLLTTLQRAGYLERHPGSQRYSLGPMVMKLAHLYQHHNPLPNIARRVFESYSDRFEYNFYFGTLRQFEVVYLAVLDGRGPLKVTTEPGGTIALHTTALGKVLLAYQDEAFFSRFIERVGLERHSPRSITELNQLRSQLAMIRRQGYALNTGEHYEDIAAVGAPVFDSTYQVFGGVSLAFPTLMLDSGRLRFEDLIPLVLEIAAEVTIRSGGRTPEISMGTESLKPMVTK